jgi:hypothetical protein
MVIKKHFLPNEPMIGLYSQEESNPVKPNPTESNLIKTNPS